MNHRQELEGHSLMPLLREPAAVWNHPTVTTDYYTASYSVAYEQWNYIRYEDGSEELYDHAADRMELTNLASDPKYSEIKTKLAQAIPTPNMYPKWHNHKEERERDRTMPYNAGP